MVRELCVTICTCLKQIVSGTKKALARACFVLLKANTNSLGYPALGRGPFPAEGHLSQRDISLCCPAITIHYFGQKTIALTIEGGKTRNRSKILMIIISNEDG